MTPQQIFDKVVTHLHTQGVQSSGGEAAYCQYRGPNGTSCAVGCLISDRNYRKSMDPAGVDALLDNFPHLPAYLRDNLALLEELQSAHDDVGAWTPDRRSFTPRLARNLRDIARDFKLSTSVLDALPTY